jgi:penicillin amidase
VKAKYRRTRRVRNLAWLLSGILVTTSSGAAIWFWPQRLSDPLASSFSPDGRLTFPTGAQATRDASGFWSVQAKSEVDASYALGFVHAHDRLFQMDMARRNSDGRLSEVLGPKTLDADILNRSYGYRQIAMDDLSETGWLSKPENAAVHQILSSYIAGINAYVDLIKGRFWYWPPEYRLFRTPPQTFTLIDVQLALASMHLYFNGSRLSELANTITLQNMRNHLSLFFGSIPEALPTIESYLKVPLGLNEDQTAVHLLPGSLPLDLRKSGTRSKRVSADLIQKLISTISQAVPGVALTGLSDAAGSNAFFCSGERTTTGTPILANDPHLALGLPSLLNAARIETPTHSSVGAYIPLVPFPVIGFSEFGAWGMTFSEIDQTDFYAVELNQSTISEATAFRFGATWHTLEKRRETIGVRGAKAVELTTARTPYGPLLELPAGDQKQLPGLSHLGVSDVTLRPGNTNIQTLYHLSRSHDVESFRQALIAHVAPPQNVHWVGVDGSAAWGLAGQLVVRNWTPKQALEAALPDALPEEVQRILMEAPILAQNPGALILPLREPFMWSGTTAAAEIAFSKRFESGCFGNANEAVTNRTDAFPSLASTDWALGLRSQRIRTLLNETPLHDAESFKAMQLDTVDNMATLALPLLLKELSTAAESGDLTPDGRELMDALNRWDQKSEASAREPLLFDRLLHDWRAAVFAKLGTPELEDLTRRRGKHNARLIVSWLRLIDTDATKQVNRSAESKNPQAILRQSLVMAANNLASAFARTGLSWTKSTWGQLHTFGPSHPLAALPIIGALYSYPPLPADGSNTSIRVQATRNYISSDELSVAHGAGLRLIVSPAEGKALVMFPSGASGVPGDARFRANYEAYNRGDYQTVYLHPRPGAAPAH